MKQAVLQQSVMGQIWSGPSQGAGGIVWTKQVRNTTLCQRVLDLASEGCGVPLKIILIKIIFEPLICSKGCVLVLDCRVLLSLFCLL